MPTWGEILAELQARKYLARLHEKTGRPVIIYYSDFLEGGGPGTDLSDMQAMMECCRGLGGGALDLVLHSPGGSAEATASIVRYLRRRFDGIRVFVPLAAMSAATMWSLAANTGDRSRVESVRHFS